MHPWGAIYCHLGLGKGSLFCTTYREFGIPTDERRALSDLPVRGEDSWVWFIRGARCDACLFAGRPWGGWTEKIVPCRVTRDKRQRAPQALSKPQRHGFVQLLRMS